MGAWPGLVWSALSCLVQGGCEGGRGSRLVDRAGSGDSECGAACCWKRGGVREVIDRYLSLLLVSRRAGISAAAVRGRPGRRRQGRGRTDKACSAETRPDAPAPALTSRQAAKEAFRSMDGAAIRRVGRDSPDLWERESVCLTVLSFFPRTTYARACAGTGWTLLSSRARANKCTLVLFRLVTTPFLGRTREPDRTALRAGQCWRTDLLRASTRLDLMQV